jgi:hypothetical protein
MKCPQDSGTQYIKQFKFSDAQQEEIEKHRVEELKLSIIQPA